MENESDEKFYVEPNRFYPISLERFEQTYVPEDHPVFEGKGASSWGRGHDGEYDRNKLAHIEAFGIILPDRWKQPENREYLLNSFIVLAGLVAWNDARRENRNHKRFYQFITRWWQEKRIDIIGYRYQEEEGPMYQDYLSRNNYPVNSQRQVSEKEFVEICEYISSALSPEID